MCSLGGLKAPPPSRRHKVGLALLSQLEVVSLSPVPAPLQAPPPSCQVENRTPTYRSSDQAFPGSPDHKPQNQLSSTPNRLPCQSGGCSTGLERASPQWPLPPSSPIFTPPCWEVVCHSPPSPSQVGVAWARLLTSTCGPTALEVGSTEPLAEVVT